MDLDLTRPDLFPATEHLIGDGAMEEAQALKQELRNAWREMESLRDELAHSRARESLLCATLDGSSEGVIALQFGREGLYFNSTFAKMWGLPQDMLATLTREQLIAFQSVQVKHPEELLAQISHYDAEAEDFNVIEMKDGRILERHARPQRMDGRSVGRVINYRDVTQRVNFEQKLLFNQVVVDSSGPMMWVDRDTREVLYANPAASELLGWRVEELVGQRVETIDLNFSAKNITPINKALDETGKPVGFQTRYRHKDSRALNVDVTVSLTENGDSSIYILSFKDITEQKAQARETKRQQALLGALINSIPDNIVYKDVNGVYLGCNDAFAALAGRSPAEIVGCSADDLFPPELARAVLAKDEEVLRTLQKRSTEEWVNYPGGQRALLDIVRNPLRDHAGRLMGILAVGRNITERKQQEEEIRRAKELAEDATRMKSDFLANMSHEIRTPMNAIIGLSHLALKTDMTPRQRDYIQKVQASGQHLLGIINDILDFSKVEAGKLSIECEEFDLETLLDHVGSLITEKAAGKGVELVFDVPPDVPRRLMGDSLRIGQILINYANNAVKYTDKGEIVVAVRMPGRDERGALLHFSVRDTGIGLTDEQKGRLFQSFTQADSSTTRKYGGTGLGLAISKRLAILMGGEVGVHSEHGKGSNFWFTVRAGVAGPSRAQLPAPDLRHLRALVVDDNENARLVLGDMLQGMTFQVTQVESGPAALDAVEQAAQRGEPFDIVYLDWRMPGMDGIETARRLKGLRLDRMPFIVMATAHGRDEALQEAQSVGIQDVLVKPVNSSVLFDTTMGALGAQTRQQQQREAPKPAPAVDPQALAAVRGARILLVEDNDINQRVACEILQDAGFVVEVADNGQQGLALVQSQAWDLVLMDMQMPVMDGITATQEIRKLPAPARLPIVAMTANAMQRDRERCIEAGMDDYITKPIDPDALLAMLVKWLPARVTNAVAAQPAPAAATRDAGGLPCIEGLDTAQGLRRMLGKKPLYLSMLRRYLDSQRDCAAQVRGALDQADWETAERLAHTAKGLAGNIGADALGMLAARLEEALREHESLVEVEERLLRFAEAQARLTDGLAQVL